MSRDHRATNYAPDYDLTPASKLANEIGRLRSRCEELESKIASVSARERATAMQLQQVRQARKPPELEQMRAAFQRQYDILAGQVEKLTEKIDAKPADQAPDRVDAAGDSCPIPDRG